MNSLSKSLVSNFKIIIVFLILMIFYEFKFYKNTCDLKKILVLNKFNLSENDEILFDLNYQINKLLRFGDEFQNHILYILSLKGENESIILDNAAIDNIEDLNKYK